MRILRTLGSNVRKTNNTLIIDNSDLQSYRADSDITFIVAPTLTTSKNILFPTNLSVSAITDPCSILILTPSFSNPLICWSIGRSIIKITGVNRLLGCNYSIIPDQIEASTYMMATAACTGEVLIKNVIPKHLESI